MANNDRKFPILYRFFDVDGEVIYIGSTWTPHLRWRSHEYARWFAEVATVTVEHFGTIEEMRAAESAAIAEEHPVYNQLGVSHSRDQVLAISRAKSTAAGISRERVYQIRDGRRSRYTTPTGRCRGRRTPGR
jgi:hypothetical protein